MDAVSAGTIPDRSNGRQGERAPLRENFRDRISRYVRNVTSCSVGGRSQGAGQRGRKLSACYRPTHDIRDSRAHERVGTDIDSRSRGKEDRPSRSQRVQRARQIEGGLRRSLADQDRVEARRFGANGGDRVVERPKPTGSYPSAATISSWPSRRSRSSATMSTVSPLPSRDGAVSSTVAAGPFPRGSGQAAMPRSGFPAPARL